MYLPESNFEPTIRYIIKVNNVYMFREKDSDDFKKYQHSFDYFKSIELINLYKSMNVSKTAIKNNLEKYELEKEQ